jgi:tRNA modification GTPase
MPPTPDTIFALSSGRPPAAIAVIRISGPRAGEALKALTGKIPSPRQAAFARIRNPQTAEIIDEALVLWFPGPASETGEDVAELQLHGGRAVIAAVLAALGQIDGLRPAEAGEFTRRAFENGKLDLTAVEGLADLVMAETQGQRRQAFRQMKGLLGGRAETWRQRLIQALALTEAAIDFSDEADVPQDVLKPALTIARELHAEIAEALADGGRGERLRDGLVVAIAGPPNAGKSTLLNLLARREAAIVSPFAGTTRDVIEVHLDLAGLPVTLLDTAGIRATDDPVEQEGVRRARERAAAADLVLWVEDAGEETSGNGEAHDAGITPVIPETAQRAGIRNPDARSAVGSGFRVPPNQVGYSRPGQIQKPILVKPEIGWRPRNNELSTQPRSEKPDLPSAPMVWRVRNKIDLLAHGKNEHKAIQLGKNEPSIQPNKALRTMVNKRLTDNNELPFTKNDLEFSISAVTGVGFAELLAALSHYAETYLAGAESALVTRERHRRALQDTEQALGRALSKRLAGHEDLIAEELRIAARALGRLTGRIDVEDILDVIFRDFCIGK